MSNKPEHWLERAARIIGGWGISIGILAFDWGHDFSQWVKVGVVVFAISMAHSTVAGIVVGSLGRAYRIIRPDKAGAPPPEPAAGTTVIEPPKKPKGRSSRT